MSQGQLFPELAPSAPVRLEDELPRERVVDGVRYCRHHTNRPIRVACAPCDLCWKEGAGIGGPATNEAAGDGARETAEIATSEPENHGESRGGTARAAKRTRGPPP